MNKQEIKQDAHIGQILTADSANGEGMRVSVFLSGCTNRCPGCFQPETWDFNYGIPYTKKIEDEIISELSNPFYAGITLLGGDPMEFCNQVASLQLLQRVKQELPEKNIWMYTGFIYDCDLIPGGKRYVDDLTDNLLDCVDVLVDGPFIEAQKDITLVFKGSKNQRVIDLKASRAQNSVILISEKQKEIIHNAN